MIKLYHGDCLELMKTIADNSVDMILCDLPYGTTYAKWDNIIPFADLWEEYKRIGKENARVVLFATQPFTTKLINSNFNDYSHIWYWKKNNVTGGTYARYQPMRCIEDVVIFTINKPKRQNAMLATYNPQGLTKLEKTIVHNVKKSELYHFRGGECLRTHTGYPKHLIEFENVPSTQRLHHTQKPVDLLKYLIKTYSNEGETVLDNCMGSGSTGVACVNTNRNFIGMELDEKYFEIAKERIENARQTL